MKFLIKYASRGRPDKFKNTLRLYREHLSRRHAIEFVISLDSDDTTMNCPAIKSLLENTPNCSFYYGNSKNKIEAINSNLDDKEFDILLLASDDMLPVARGYDDIIITLMRQSFPNLDGALHFNDGRQGETLNTLSIMGYNMYKHFGYIYHPDYYSVFCDNEFMDVTRLMKKAVYNPKIIIKHDWTDYTGIDALHLKNESYYSRDKMVFEKRRSLGYPPDSILDRL
jgi:virulence-associated protein VapD